jgi:ABC-type nitrate/sulfonate/bicarbonate transport system substrate-binding protein
MAAFSFPPSFVWSTPLRTVHIAIIILLAAFLAVLGGIALMDRGTAPGQPALPLTVGMEPSQVNTLIYIADEQGYFAANGLNVTIRDYPSGAAATEGLLRGENEIATATEFVLVGKALDRVPLRTFGSIDEFEQIYLVCRNDTGVRDVPDLAGKTIGLSRKTAAEFYLGRFLELHGMNIREVNLVDVRPPQIVDALSNGNVDAVVTWQPHVSSIQERMGDGVVAWPVQSGQPAFCIAICTGEWTDEHPDEITRFVRALSEAQGYLIRNPGSSKAILSLRANYSNAYVQQVWPEHHFFLSLDQALVSAMEDEARWEIRNNLTGAETLPDFQENIYTGGLERVKPESVNIIR